MTSEGMPLLPDAFPQARELIALRNKTTEGGRSNLFIKGRRLVPSTTVSVTMFSVEWGSW